MKKLLKKILLSVTEKIYNSFFGIITITYFSLSKSYEELQVYV